MSATPIIDEIFAAHGIRGPWTPLPALGIANSIYATRDVVLRVATDNPEAIPDARTESVAAPVAHGAGILTPRLIAFDDSRTLVNQPYSLWERVRGETLGAITLGGEQRAQLWRQIGRELARLHTRVTACDDPNGWLDSPGRRMDLEDAVTTLRDAERLDSRTAADVIAFIREISRHVDVDATSRFVHDDLHAWNVMCSPAGELLAIIDWGDAGWGDPTLDFAYIPLDDLVNARAGYAPEAPGLLGRSPEARFAWDHLQHGLEHMLRYGHAVPDIRALSRLLG